MIVGVFLLILREYILIWDITNSPLKIRAFGSVSKSLDKNDNINF